MSKQEEAGLILKLYELRREETMRKARTWFIRDFFPESIADFNTALFGENSGYLRMVVTYWDMAAAFVNHGAVSLELFSDTNSEHFAVFAKVEPLLVEIRDAHGQGFASGLEKLIYGMPDGRERLAKTHERLRSMRARLAERKTGFARLTQD